MAAAWVALWMLHHTFINHPRCKCISRHVTGLWGGWWGWSQWYYYFGGAGGHTTKAHMWFYRGFSSACNSAVNYQLWSIQLTELESKVAEHGQKKKVRRNVHMCGALYLLAKGHPRAARSANHGPPSHPQVSRDFRGILK